MEIALEHNMLSLIIEKEERYNVAEILNQAGVKENITVYQYWCLGTNACVKYDYEKEGCNLLYNIYGDVNVLKYVSFEISRLHTNKMKLEDIFSMDV